MGMCQVNIDPDLMIIADNGVIIRTPVKDISLIGRSTQGVRIMKLREGAKIVCVQQANMKNQKKKSLLKKKGQKCHKKIFKSNNHKIKKNKTRTKL